MSDSSPVPSAPHAPSVPHSAPHLPPAMPRPLTPAGGIPPRASVGIPTLAKPKDDLSSLSLVDDAPTATAPNKIIRAFGVKEEAADRKFERHSELTGKGAVHVKSFHGHLGDEGLRRLDDKINDWLENHTFAEVKFVTTTIGVWDGKTKDQAMIINIWY